LDKYPKFLSITNSYGIYQRVLISAWGWAKILFWQAFIYFCRCNFANLCNGSHHQPASRPFKPTHAFTRPKKAAWRRFSLPLNDQTFETEMHFPSAFGKQIG
jgi:hypothetical protein